MFNVDNKKTENGKGTTQRTELSTIIRSVFSQNGRATAGSGFAFSFGGECYGTFFSRDIVP
jgi:hypothetical protein